MVGNPTLSNIDAAVVNVERPFAASPSVARYLISIIEAAAGFLPSIPSPN